MICLLLTLLLAAPAWGSGPALSLEQAQAALEAGHGLRARELAIQALALDTDLEALAIYIHGSRAAGLGPLVQAELWDLAERDAQVRVLATEIAVRDDELAIDALRSLAGQFPDPGQMALAALLWEREGKAGALALAPDDPHSADVTRLRLQVTVATAEVRLAGVLARAWMRKHPEAPDVLAALWGPAPEGDVHRRAKGAALKWLDRTLPARAEEPLFLYRALTLLKAADQGEAADAVLARLVSLGFPAQEPTHGERFREALAEADARRRADDFEGALEVWVALRAQSDGADAALGHARLLQDLLLYEDAFDVALRARSLAAGPVAEDLACLDTAAHAVRLADATGLIAELALSLARTGTAREAAAVAHALDAHPRWTALVAQAAVLPENPDDPGLPADPRVLAVQDTLIDPTRGDAWVARAGHHEAAGERYAAFVAWAVARAYQAPVDDALRRTWDGIGDPDRVATAALEAFHAARRGHRDAIAGLRADLGVGAPIEHAFVAPGPGLRLPDWTAVDVEGGPFGSESLAGKPYILSVWASWCMPCLLELPDLNQRIASMKEPIRAVAVSVDDRETIFRRKAREEAWVDLLLGWNPDLSATLGVDGLPTSFVVDGKGRIVHVEHGYSPQGVGRLLEHVDRAR